MPSNEEKKRRKELLRTWEQNEHKQQEDNLPVGKENLISLFVWVDDKWAEYGCDHTLRYTIEFLRLHGLPEERVVDWLFGVWRWLRLRSFS